MDSRFPTYYLQDRRVLKATPTAFRLFVVGTAWAVSNMTDGKIAADDFPLIPLAQPHDADELVRLGLWSKLDDGWFIQDFPKTQTSAAQMETALENRREADRVRQAKARAKRKAQAEQAETTSDNQESRDGHVTLEGRGKAEAEAEARTMNHKHSENFNEETGEVFDPPINQSSTSDPWVNIPMKDQQQETDSTPNLMDQFMNTDFGRQAS